MNKIKQFFIGKEPKNPPDLLQNIMGTWGRYQFILCCIIFPSKFFGSFHQMAIIFLAPKVKYTCPPSNEQICPCAKPVYDRSVFTRTIIMEWDLICEKRYMTSFVQMIFQSGVLVGSVSFGIAADRFGRRKPFLAAIVIQMVSGLSAAYIPEFWTFVASRFFTGAAVGGTMVVSFVIIMEFIGAQYRDTISALYQVPFNMGHMLVAVFSYFYRDYSHFQLWLSVPSAGLLIYFILVPETPRWLIAAKHTEKGIEALEKVARTNKRPTENIRSDIEKYQAMIAAQNLKKGTIIDLFRTPNLRKNIICMALNWLACSYCFYGISQYIGHLSGNPFVNVLTSASVTLLGTLTSIPLMKVIGRRTILIIFNFVCSSCLVALSFVPPGPASILLASVGTVSSFIVFVVVYLYCSEMFPTVVRNAAIGFCSMCARVGSMIAPFVIDLEVVAHWLPPVVFATAPLVAGCVTFLLPETKGCELTTTIAEGEAFGRKKKRVDPPPPPPPTSTTPTSPTS